MSLPGYVTINKLQLYLCKFEYHKAKAMSVKKVNKYLWKNIKNTFGKYNVTVSFNIECNCILYNNIFINLTCWLRLNSNKGYYFLNI